MAQKDPTVKEAVVIQKNSYAKTGAMGSGWFLGFVGALVYFLHYHSGTLWLVVVAVWKAVFWPAYLVFYLLRFMHI